MTTPTSLDAVRELLLGAWRLVAWRIAGAGKSSEPFGPGADGLIVYTADGWMNASIARADRARLSAGSVRQASAAEQCAAFESYFNYAGPYTLRAIDGVAHVVHSVQFSLNPNFVGSEQVRRIRFDGDNRLRLSADESVGSGLRQHGLDWRRV